MNKVKSLEIPYKKYANEYRQIKRLYSFGDCELIVLKDVISKDKFVALQKDISTESELVSILRQLARSLEIFEYQGVSKFIGFVNGTVRDKIQGKQIKQIVLIFDYCNKPLETVITNSKNLNKQESCKLITLLITKLFDIFVTLQANSINLGFIVIDFNLVIINSWGQADQGVNVVYLPFTFVHEGFLTLKNFTYGIYSSRELQNINIKERRGMPGLNRIPKNNEGDIWNGSNRQVLQKIGLFLIRMLNQLNPQVLMQPELNLYTMNDHFNIDVNWTLVYQFLEQCNKIKGYSSIVKIIRFMIDCKDEKSFSSYRSILQQNKVYPLKKQSNYNEQTMTTLKSIEERIPANSQLVKYQDGGIYKGCLNNGVRQGYGVYYFSEGQLYGGEWRNDQMTGNGIYLFMNKESYVGEVLCGIKEGTGVYYYHNGDQYSGQWHDDIKQGQGEHFCASTGERYVGMFIKNIRSGRGTIHYSNKHRFEGIFQNGLKHGQGSLFDQSNRMYLQGCWKNGQVESGQIFLENGDYYKGELKDNKKNGQGIYQYSDGTVYEGDFLNDEQSGQCLIKYPNGDQYEGRIHKGLFQGKGKYVYHNSELIYEGNWNKGIADGSGSYYYCQHIKLSAVMDKGELVSYSILPMQIGDMVPLFNDHKLTII